MPLRLDPARTLDEQIEEHGAAPDVVFLELFGETALPRDISASRHRLAAYCIDAPLNEFWLIPLARLFDHVYVDQQSSVPRFRESGVDARWLPLCANEGDFRAPAEKRHLISFVGRTTPHRTKRNNLLRHLSEHVPVNVVQGVSTAEMLDVFAASHMVLNENFFSGLNLRFFHALASGSLLLTERRGYGVARHFREGRHYLGYAPGDVVSVIRSVEQGRKGAARIAARGQEECVRHHTSAHRARVVVRDLTEAGTGRDAATRQAARLAHASRLDEAEAKYHHALRFGGPFVESVALLEHAATASDGPETVGDPDGADSPHRGRTGHAPGLVARTAELLGGILLRQGRTEAGVALLQRAAAPGTESGMGAGAKPTMPPGLAALLKLLLLHAEDTRRLTCLGQLTSALLRAGRIRRRYLPYLNALKNDRDTRYNCCMLACEILHDAGRNHHLGFLRQEPEHLPDTALEYALLAFAAQKTTEALDAIIRCTAKAGIGPEALPFIRQATLAGVATDAQIALSASLALEYYDFSFSKMTVRALKKTLA
ncbi:MAG TPA: glycosyltransferase [Nitratidesulfovibrio sp.]|nr:glycosyltransferase [Nitratidesulfovibrio sp.]